MINLNVNNETDPLKSVLLGIANSNGPIPTLEECYDPNSLMHIKMRKKEVKHEFRIRDGGHNWTYWRSALPSVLEFISQKFHQ